MANLQYIGARYVPKFYLNPDDSSNDWKSGVLYEALTIVTYNNDSYTSKITVPASVGNPADNPQYWACTTKYTAALQALQTIVQNLEDYVDIIPLHTVSDTVSGAINELYDKLELSLNSLMTRPFIAQRIGSPAPNVWIGQCGAYANGKYILVGTNGDTNINIGIVDPATFNIDNVYTFNYAIHPNAAFIVGGHLYVVDSLAHDLYKFKIAGMVFEEKITTFEYTNCFGGSSYGDYVYLMGGSNVYILDTAFNFVKLLQLDLPKSSSGFNVRQGVFAYKDLIFVVYNRPNAIVIYDFDGNLVSIKELGDGDGYYPFGEVEGFINVNDEVEMLAGGYHQFGNWLKPSALTSYLQIFKTNLGSNILSNAIMGQSYPILGGTIYVNNSSHNAFATGSSAKPFSSMYEASCFAAYHPREYDTISITLGADAEDDLLVLAGDYTIDKSGANLIKYASLNAGKYNLIRVDFGRLYSENATLNLYSTISGLNAQNDVLLFNGSKITDELIINKSKIADNKIYATCAVSDITLNDVAFYEVFDNGANCPDMKASGAECPLQPIIEKTLFDLTASSTTTIEFDFLVIGGQASYYPVKFNVTSGDKTTINGGGYQNYNIKFNAFLSGGMGELSFTLRLERTKITLQNLSATVNGSSVTFPTLYIPMTLINRLMKS